MPTPEGHLPEAVLTCHQCGGSLTIDVTELSSIVAFRWMDVHDHATSVSMYFVPDDVSELVEGAGGDGGDGGEDGSCDDDV